MVLFSSDSALSAASFESALGLEQPATVTIRGNAQSATLQVVAPATNKLGAVTVGTRVVVFFHFSALIAYLQMLVFVCFI